MDAPPHPRDVFGIDGVEAAELSFLDALDRGRLHHAWLLTGPEGVGKATLAYRMARRLLGAKPDPAFGALGASPSDVVSRQVAARSHPDLTLIFDLPAKVGLARAVARGGEARFESKGLAFHERLAAAFLEIARREPERCVVIEADDAIDAVWADVWTAVSTRLGL